MALGKCYYFIWLGLFRTGSGWFGRFVFFSVWPQLFTGAENTARTGLGNPVLGQHFLFMAIPNYFSKSNRAGPE